MIEWIARISDEWLIYRLRDLVLAIFAIPRMIRQTPKATVIGPPILLPRGMSQPVEPP
ncbi:MAG TPA: hypothetical protein VL992_00015 [Tepidisphaeraceae bacterium]|nr:hypothetical protein [Tepidisphaeraceae bacterium]